MSYTLAIGMMSRSQLRTRPFMALLGRTPRRALSTSLASALALASLACGGQSDRNPAVEDGGADNGSVGAARGGEAAADGGLGGSAGSDAGAGPGAAGRPQEPPPPRGDQRVFSGIDARIVVRRYDAVDLNARDPDTGAFPPEPPIHVAVTSSVEINGGTSDGRVPDLRIFVDGKELTELSSAASPPKYSFDRRLPDAAESRIMLFELRRENSSFSIEVEPLVVDIIEPAAELTLAAADAIVLRWTGTDELPSQASIAPRGQNCSVGFEPSSDDVTTFVPRPQPGGGGKAPPCRFELTAAWQAESSEASPFRSLSVERYAARIQRFDVE